MNDPAPAPPRAARGVGAATAGVLLGPLIATLLAVGFAPAQVLAALLMIAMTVLGAAGVVRAAVVRRAARRAAAPVEEGPLTRFRALEQTGSAAVAVVLLAVGALTAAGWGAVQVLISSDLGRQVDGLLVLALGGVLVGACAVPTVLLQARWLRRPGAPEAEAAVLDGRAPGPRRRILAARAVTTTAWVAATALAGVLAVLVSGTAVGAVRAAVGAYRPAAASAQLRTLLSIEDYLAADVRCQSAPPNPFVESTIRCRLTSLGTPHEVEATWTPSGYGSGDLQLRPASLTGLARVRDLPPAPTPVPLRRALTGPQTAQAVRAQLVAEGFDTTRPPLSAISCPGVDAGPDGGSVRCTLGTGYRERFVEVYPDGATVLARTSMLADLR